MFAVVVNVTIDPARASEAEELLHGTTVPMVKQAPGFVSGTWVRATDATSGQSLLLFETEDAASAAASRVRQLPPPAGPVALRSAEVFEVLAQA